MNHCPLDLLDFHLPVNISLVKPTIITNKEKLYIQGKTSKKISCIYKEDEAY